MQNLYKAEIRFSLFLSLLLLKTCRRFEINLAVVFSGYNS